MVVIEGDTEPVHGMGRSHLKSAFLFGDGSGFANRIIPCGKALLASFTPSTTHPAARQTGGSRLRHKVGHRTKSAAHAFESRVENDHPAKVAADQRIRLTYA
jgi:hypothetical protein